MPNCTEVHRWATMGLWVDGFLCLPCLAPDCAAYLRRWADRWVFVPTGFGPTIGDIALDIEDDPVGGVAKLICLEIVHSYALTALDLPPGATVIDIGAHVGIVAIYLARRYPGIRVLAYEPQPDNYARLLRNIAANGVAEQVIPHLLAVTGDGRDLALHGDGAINSGGWTAYGTGGAVQTPIASTTLRDIFATYQVDRCAVLKIDCEGAEYEILQGAGDLLGWVDYLAGEFHVSSALTARYGAAADLLARCHQYIPPERVRVGMVNVGA